MLIVVIYLVVVAVCTFALCTGWGMFVEDEDDFFLIPIFAGAFWPIGLPLCAGYIAAKWVIDYFT